MSSSIKKIDRSTYTIKSVSHALDLLEQFTGEQVELGVTALSRRLSLGKNNVFRLLATLESRNFIEQSCEAGTYRLGLKTLELGHTITQHLLIQQHANPIINALVTSVNETASVVSIKEDRVIYLNSVETTLPVRVVAPPGVWFPTFCTAAGKVHLAAIDNRDLLQYISADLLKYTPNTITDMAALRCQLAQVTLQGYAVDNEEFNIGVKCVSAPIYNSIGRVTGAVTMTGPSSRFSEDRMVDQIIPAVVGSAAEISVKLGFSKR